MEEAKSIISTSEFNDSQTQFPPNVLANSGGFNRENSKMNSKLANQGHLTHFGSSQEYSDPPQIKTAKEQA